MGDSGGMVKSRRISLHTPSELCSGGGSPGDTITYKVGTHSIGCLVPHSVYLLFCRNNIFISCHLHRHPCMQLLVFLYVHQYLGPLKMCVDFNLNFKIVM